MIIETENETKQEKSEQNKENDREWENGRIWREREIEGARNDGSVEEKKR